MSIFARLQFDSAFQGDNVTPMSDNVIKHMDAMPQMLNEWQKTDVGNSDTSGYLQNPVGTVSTNIWNVANNIISVTGLASSNITQVLTAATTLSTAANTFMQHTNRMSGAFGADPNDPTLPTYRTAIGAGKLISYIVYQSDGVQNNAPMIGSFTSIYSGDNLATYYSTIQNYASQVQNSIIATTDPITFEITYTSNLSQSTANTMASNLSNTASFMNTRRTADVTFYNNSQSVISDYNNVRQFSNMGATETDLTNNLIGTTKLTSRLNS